MRKIINSVVLVLLFLLLGSSVSFARPAGEPRKWIGQDKGDYPEVYTCYVATTPFNIVASSVCKISTDILIENNGVDAWFVFSSTKTYTDTISTGPVVANSINGNITGEDGYLRNGVSKSWEGRLGMGMWARTVDTTGTKIRITIFKRYNWYPRD